MTYFIGLLLVAAHGLPWLLQPGRAIYASPMKVIATFSAVTNLPYFVLLAGDFQASGVYTLIQSQFEHVLQNFGILYSLGLLATFAGIGLTRRLALPNLRLIPVKQLTRRNLATIIAFLYALGVAMILLKFQAAGGIVAFVTNIADRSENLAGTGHYDIIMMPAVFLCVFFAIYSRGMNGKPGLLVIGFILLSLFGLLTLFGGRKLPLYLGLFGVLAYSRYVGRIRLFSLPTLSLLALAVLFFWAMLSWRISSQLHSTGGVDFSYTVVTGNLSYIDNWLFILDHFGRQGFWYGQTFIDLVARFEPAGPSGYPPLDDGVYVRTLATGQNVIPPTPFSQMYPSSWPPETFGNGYLNFGIAGVLVFSLIRGLVVGVCYRYCVRDNFAPTAFFVFLFTAINFHVTNLRIVQMATLLAGMLLLSVAVSVMGRIRWRPA